MYVCMYIYIYKICTSLSKEKYFQQSTQKYNINMINELNPKIELLSPETSTIGIMSPLWSTIGNMPHSHNNSNSFSTTTTIIPNLILSTKNTLSTIIIISRLPHTDRRLSC